MDLHPFENFESLEIKFKLGFNLLKKGWRIEQKWGLKIYPLSGKLGSRG